jgi:NADH-quinone oxidoreductase subunit K
MTIGLGHYLSVAAILFTLGIFGIFLNRKNVIIILMSIELILLAVNINLVAFSTHLGDIVGQVFALFVLTVAAAEAAIGLAILVVFFRNRGTIAVEEINLMKGGPFNVSGHRLSAVARGHSRRPHRDLWRARPFSGRGAASGR